MSPPSNVALRFIVEEDPRLVQALNEAYAEADADGGLDKPEREALQDVIGRHFTGRTWPRKASMEGTKRFMADLQRAMVAAGWKVDMFAVAA